MTINGGYLDMVGIEFDAGTTNPSTWGCCSANNVNDFSFTNCIFKEAASGSAYKFQIGNAGQNCSGRFKSCTWRFTSSVHAIQVNRGNLVFEDCVFADSGSIPAGLFLGNAAGAGGTVRVIGGDASTINTALVGINESGSVLFTFENLKLHASVAATTSSWPAIANGSVAMVCSDSTTGNYRKYYSDYNGTIQSETSIVHTGGATDGTTPISWNTASSANTTFRSPLKIGELRFWNNATGSSQTVTVELTTNTALNTANLGLVIDYMNSASFPTTAKVTSLPASAFDSTSALTTSSETWGGTAQTYKYKIALSYTPLMKGFVKGNLYLSLPSSGAVYIDPKFIVSGINYTRSEQMTSTYLTEVNSGGAGGASIIGSSIVQGRIV
jgi:hypothetical protein